MNEFGSRGRGRGRGGQGGRGGGGRGRGGFSASSAPSQSREAEYYGNQQGRQQRPAGTSATYEQKSYRQPLQMPESEKFKKLVTQKLRPAGTAGQAIPLIGNFYKMLHSDVTVFHYDLNFTKEKKDKVKKPTKEPEKKPEVEFPKKVGKTKKKSKKQVEDEVTEEVVVDDETEAEKLDEEMSVSFERFLKKFSPLIVEKLVAQHSEIFRKDVHHVYDGFKNLYTAKALVFPESKTSKELEAKLDQEKKSKNKKKKQHGFISKVSIMIDSRLVDFLVEIKLVERVFLSEALEYYQGKMQNAISERVISVFEIIFGFVFGQSFICYQRKFFNLNDSESAINIERCQFVHGFINSVRMTEFGLALNVHLKTTCIISKSFDKLDQLAINLMGIQDLENDPFTVRQFKEMNRIIRHLKIYTNHSKEQKGALKTRMTYTVDCLIDKRPSQYYFNMKNGQKISIYQYFDSEYKILLKNYPLVKTTGKKARYLPLELCILVEKQFMNNSKIDNQIQKELLLKSTHTPNIYFDRLNRIVRQVSGLDKPLQTQFGLGMTLKPVSFEGRVLPAPKQINGQRKDPFCLPKKANNWAIICFDEPRFRTGKVKDEDLLNFVKEMRREAIGFKMEFTDARKSCIIHLKDIDSVKGELSEVMKNLAGLELILVGIPSRHSQIKNTTDLYQLVKHYCDQVYGVISQCFKSDNLGRIPRGYFDNFLLKVNGKIGGKNNVIDSMNFRMLMPALTQPTMIVGVDVNHPGETEKVMSSVSAAVGSYDAEYSKYSASIRVQKKERDEMVKQLDEMILELLKEYKKENQQKFPSNLIVFRDGVSEGQFEKVISTEIPLIRSAINKTNKDMKLTVVVVQKRHHTRFVRAEPLVLPQKPGRPPNKPIYNVPSGTVVDQCIVEPIYKMFYLNSHFSQLGTSKPTKYIILLDELNFTTDNIQKFCFYSCHTCIRTRLVSSIPIPVRYADLCAYRSKAHIEAQRLITATTDGTTTQKNVDPQREEDTLKQEETTIRRLNKEVKIKEKIRNLLYYC